jgi:RHH-type proline utilization regulon transcriptional repressor/proline dehydrogenase/delta 1-pyrroline-5-carboxylate dehydrogenase
MQEWNSIPELSPAALAAIESRTREVGEFLFTHLEKEHTSVFQRRWWDDQLMNLAMRDESLKVQMFRFVDVLPMLKTTDEIVDHLQEYLGEARSQLPVAVRAALGIGRRTAFTRAAIARIAKLSAMDLARRFIAGTNTREVVESAKRERERDRGFTLDILGEAVISHQEADRFFHAYVDLIEQVAPEVNAWPDNPLVDDSPSGPLPRMNLSIKLSALDGRFDAIDPAGSLERAGAKLRELLRVAKKHRAFINVDMESYAKKDLTLAIFQHVLAEPEFRQVEDVGIVIQCYLRDSPRDLQALADWTRQRGTPIWVRLVKGAYWDYETVLARAEGWPIPVYQNKWESDASFECATRFVMSHADLLRPALGTHNIRSMAHGIAVAEHLGLPTNGFELQMLYGMADPEKQALVRFGRRLRIYMPYGELIPGMAYLVRRLLENTSNNSFVRAGFVDQVGWEKLLANPADQTNVSGTPDVVDQSAPTHVSPATSGVSPMSFQNEPPIDFSVAANRQAMNEALDKVRGSLGVHRPLVIGDRQIDTPERFASMDPSFRERLVGSVAQGDRGHVDHAVHVAREAGAEWQNIDATRRAGYLRDMAQILRDRLFELAAWEVYECGKAVREATGDICEAIDFCRYYAAGAEALAQPQGVDLPGEENRFEYIPRGVVAIIAPWNFPLAILTGMTVAALATGNTVVMKPAEQSSIVGSLLMEVAQQAQLPPGVLNFLPGRGEVVGAALVEHPFVAMIAFTGSQKVGLAINAKAAEVSAREIGYVKRVVAEMGGKNAIIVDNDADLDEAVMAVVKSAFGYQGQKCSACSRVIVLEGVYETFLRRLIDAATTLHVGPAESPATDVGPVIDVEAAAKIREYIQLGRTEAREVFSADIGELAEQGCYIGPHIFAEVLSTSRLAQEEIFGPVLAVIRAINFDAALTIANSTQYALTGGLFSRSPANVARAKQEFLVGNLYINRPITGALVGRQPFGGFKMSGIGSKAGGPDYLLQFVLPRTITENTMRRGFAPE